MTGLSAEARLIRAAVDQLRIAAAAPHPNHERCHWQEDALYLNTLKGIAFGLIDDPRTCAAEAIKAAGIQFGRGCE